MRLIIIIFILKLLLINDNNAQNIYYVINVIGEIELVGTDKLLKTGHKLKDTQQVKFLTENAKAVVIGSNKGRMVISKKQSIGSTDSEFVHFLKNVLFPQKTSTRLSTRGNDSFVIEDFEDYFGGSFYAFIGNQLKIPIDIDKFPIDKNRVIVYRYYYNKAPVQKILPAVNSMIIFDKEKLYERFGKKINMSLVSDTVELYYVNKLSRATTSLVSFKPIFLNQEKISTELKVLVEYFKNVKKISHPSITQELYDYVQATYGKVNFSLFKSWLDTNSII